MSTSAFGVEHGIFSKAEKEPDHTKRNVAIGAGGTAAVGGTALAATKIPEHSHYDKKTRKYLHSLPAGEYDLPTKMLAKNPRKLGARKNQKGYVAAMAQERPEHTYSPVPITRYKGKGHPTIQRDNAHSVMAHSMLGRKTVRVKIEDAPGYKPHRMTGEELIRRGQGKYQQRRLRQNTKLPKKKIERLVDTYTNKQRKANTAKRPHGVVEESFKMSKQPYGLRTAVQNPKKIAQAPRRIGQALDLVKKDDRKHSGKLEHDLAVGGTGAAGVATLASTPVRRSGKKIKVKGGTISAKDAKKVVSPGYRPGNRRAIQVMAANMGHLEGTPTTVIRYKDGKVIPFDGNHRATARIARGDKKIPVQVIRGQERPTVSAARNVYHGTQQLLHRERMNRGIYKPVKEKGSTYTPKHRAEPKTYKQIANASPIRSGTKEAIEGSKFAAGPTKRMLRTRQGATVAAGSALLGTAAYLHRKQD